MNLTFTQKMLDIACANRAPVSGTFELTSRCNLDCRMCYIHSRANDAKAIKAEKDTAWWLDKLNAAQEAGALTLLITGGEPFLRPDFCKIYSACKDAGLLVSVNTNATLLTDEILDTLTAQKPLRVNVSLYGMSDESYQSLCGQSGMFSRATENILRMKRRGIPMRLNYTVTEHNIDDAAALYAFSQEHQIPVQAATYTFPAVRACEFGACENERVSPELAAEYQYRWDKLANPPQWHRERAAKAREALRQTQVAEDCSRCRGGLSSWWISWDGKIYACSMLNGISANLDEIPFEEAWEKIKEQAKQMILPRECRICPKKPFCEACPAGCMAENSSFDKSPSYLCRKTDAYLRLLVENAEQK